MFQAGGRLISPYKYKDAAMNLTVRRPIRPDNNERLLAMTLGILCAGIGGELFVRGIVGLARWARVSPGIIGATVAAFATSSPELSVL